MGRISSFITGAAIGAAAALLFAPKTGEQTRAFVTEKANAVVGEAKDFGAGMPGAAQDILNTVQQKGTEFVKGAASQVSAPAAAQPDDELRQKIEAARQRIAAQVAENAEAAKAVEIPAEA